MWVEVMGNKYSNGCVLQYGYDEEEDYPLFGVVLEINTFVEMMDNRHVVFLIEPLKTTSFERHFHCYITAKRPAVDSVVIAQSELEYYLPLHRIEIERLRAQYAVVPRFYQQA